MRVRFAVLADYSNITHECKIYILGFFDILNAPQFPVAHAEMQLVMRFEADISERNHQKDVEVRLIDARANQIIQLHGRIAVRQARPGDFLFFNQVLVFRNIEFPSPGDYQFDIYIDGNLQHTTPLKVVDSSAGPNI